MSGVDLPPETSHACRELDGRRPLTLPPPPPDGTRRRRGRWLLWLAGLATMVWAVAGTRVGPRSLVEGRAGAARLLRGMVPPEVTRELLARVMTAVVETVQISLAALLFGALLGLPLAVLIAGNVGAPGWLASAARVTAAGLRGVPELLWALLFVATVGLGPAAGAYAIGLHAAGMIAKLCSEQLEAVDPAPVEALRVTGTPRLATSVLTIIPQARNGLASLLLYQWECNIRSSAVVGFVGAGGIGQALGIALRLFRYRELATLLAATLVLVLGVDRLSRLLRRRMGAAAR
ncbi:MAG TPA: phosphonate ABC transporter, permease protein PhnE [Actinomycetes bacterium]|jgi:phosphonate transport system permease protein|nr:phosphonate ABC transporter, permease protein PhnE [Actinomycetes bacterium]